MRVYEEWFFEWDEEKNKRNIAKHQYDFKEVVHVFGYPLVETRDSRKNYGEERIIAMGNLQGRVVVVVYTQRRNRIRIISLRKANVREQKIYKEGRTDRHRG